MLKHTHTLALLYLLECSIKIIILINPDLNLSNVLALLKTNAFALMTRLEISNLLFKEDNVCFD